MEVVMVLVYRSLLAVHILAAVGAVVVFWLAAIARKGSARHVTIGRLFVLTMTVMMVSSLGMSAFNLAVPNAIHTLEEFKARSAVFGADMSLATPADLARDFRLNAVWLVYVAVQLLVSLRFGTMVVRERSTCWGVLGADLTLAGLMAVAGVGLLAFGLRVGHALITAFGVMGALGSGRRVFVLLRPAQSRMAWWYEHMSALLGVGLPLHVTMLLAIGRHLPGPAGSWRLAMAGVALLGLPATTMWVGYYRRRFESRPTRTYVAQPSRTAASIPA
jgi:hypothetical protein